jgi:hypothetical protein
VGLFNHAQTSFAAGELSPAALGNFGSELYAKGLAWDESWIPRSLGSLLMRAGTKDVVGVDAERLIPFYVADGEPFQLVLSAGKLRIRDSGGAAIMLPAAGTNKITNGTFAGDAAGWTLSYASWNVGGFVRVGSIGPAQIGQLSQNVALEDGHPYRIRFRARCTGNGQFIVSITPQGGGPALVAQALDATTQFTTYEVPFNATAAVAAGVFSVTGGADQALNILPLDVDDVSLIDESVPPAQEMDTPWTTEQLARLQYDQDGAKSQMLFVHGNVQPRLLTKDSSGVWTFAAQAFTGQASWADTNWPSVIDWGFQGRLWLGATPSDPNVFLGAKIGSPFDFTQIAEPTASDAVSFTASIRGALRWIRGQVSLLLGAERVEQSASSGDGPISAANPPNVRDESAFGSAAIQAAHIGDEVLFVGRDRRSVRALSFDGQVKNGFVAQAISLVAEHLLRAVKEIHFARSPQPLIFALGDDGQIVGCSYDKALDIRAWWRVPVGGPVLTASTLETADGATLWLSVTRANGAELEILPLHEVGVEYLDSWQRSVVDANGEVAGLERLNGQAVTVKLAGAVHKTGVAVADGKIGGLEDIVGETVLVGLPYRPKAKTLKPEGGSPKGTAQGSKRKRPAVFLRLNDSAPPLVNGERPDGAVPVASMDTPEGRVTGDVEYPGIDWEEDGQITIEQDQPFRTEVLAAFGPVQVNDL